MKNIGFALPRPLRSKALAGTAAEPVLALVAVAVLAGAFLADQLTPKTVSVSSLAVVPVLLVAWLLSARAIAVVALVAVALQLWLGLDEALAWPSVGANLLVIALTALVGHRAAANTEGARAARERQLSILLDIANRLNAAGDLQAILEDVAGAARRFVAHSGEQAAARGTVWTLTDKRLEAAAESDELGVRLRGHRFEPGPRVIEVLAARKPVQLPLSALSDELRETLDGAGVRSIAVAPVVAGGDSLFGMVTASARDSLPFTATELELLGGLAQVAGLAIARARQGEVERRRMQVLQVLNEVMREAGSAGSTEEVSSLVAEKARTLVGATVGALVLRDPESGSYWVDAATGAVGLVAAAAGRGVVGSALAGQAGAGSPPWAEAADAQLAGPSPQLLATPVRTRDQVLGALVVAGEAFGEHEVRLLTLLGAQLGPALDALHLRGEVVESEQRLRALCSSLGCGAVIHDAAGRILDANWAAAELTGRSQADLVSSGIFGRDWAMDSESGVPLPEAMRPPGYVLRFDRPLRGLVARVQPPRGAARWLRIDSLAFKQRDRVKWVVTTFFEAPAPASEPASPAAPRRSRRTP
ncbi:MAG TPA: GAF domain-containing protein [Candidatus Dormibacteraeota bacterium]